MCLALASKPQILENCPVFDLKRAVSFELLKVCGAPEKFFGKRFFSGDCLKIFSEDLFFLESTCACVLGPWPRAFLFLASKWSVLDNGVLSLGFFFCVLGLGLGPWPRALCPRLHLW